MAPPEVPLLAIDGLTVDFALPEGALRAVDGVGLTVARGEAVGVVGESGSGKSQLFLAVMGLLAPNARAAGSVRFKGQEILGLPSRRLRPLRGRRMAMVFQDPMTALNPYLRVSTQMTEVLRCHQGLDGAAARRRALELLDLVRIPDAARRFDQYPHALSGGMRQRVMIAMALLCRPDLLIADEPTTALDVTVQAAILDLLRDIRRELNTAVVLITHDFGVVAGLADRVVVMKSGRVVEDTDVHRIFRTPQHPDTRLLIQGVQGSSIPGGGAGGSAPGKALLSVRDLKVGFTLPRGWCRKPLTLAAVNGISFDLREGETLGIVGESGCGKSTLGRAVLRLIPAGSGQVVWLGRDLVGLREVDMRERRRDLQIIFQDPFASLDPRMTVGAIVAEPLTTLYPELRRPERDARVAAMLSRVGLTPDMADRYPHEFSGGQAQRIGIARAMIPRPRVIVCDEPVSALDAAIRGQIVALLRRLQDEDRLSLLFISHDLTVVRQISHRIMVLYLGRMMEMADTEALGRDPRHPYTRALLSAVPVPDPAIERSRTRVVLTGDLPSPLAPPSGCVFRTRCPQTVARCAESVPAADAVAPGHRVACHFRNA